ncbi:MAG TPA: L-threonylcarbamoyladenylate synthase [Verrucomicrobiae bacterium]|nr:L-threonylcarbamoyladenylate synthase [Verrucomicrobiae bacterium]
MSGVGDERPIFAPDPGGVAAAARCLDQGGILAIPTDTVFGLGVAAGDRAPAARLARVKGRSPLQPVILMAASPAALLPFVGWTALAQGFGERHWPGPLTLILAASAAGRRLGGPGTIAVRVPALPLLVALLEQSGPLATTSANRHGEPPVTSAAAALRALPLIDAALQRPAGPAGPGIPSSILDCTADRPVLVRVGALDASALGLAGGDHGSTGSA